MTTTMTRTRAWDKETLNRPTPQRTELATVLRTTSWWNTVQPHDMLASKRNARRYLPKGATAMYNNLRRRLLTLCQLPKHDPLHRAAWMAFSALEMLILALSLIHI